LSKTTKTDNPRLSHRFAAFGGGARQIELGKKLWPSYSQCENEHYKLSIRDPSQIDIGRKCRERPFYNGDVFVLARHATAMAYPIGGGVRREEEGLSFG
jgi:hypothetical protein